MKVKVKVKGAEDSKQKIDNVKEVKQEVDYLALATNMMFSHVGKSYVHDWSSSQEITSPVDARNLPYHLRDETWLTKLLTVIAHDRFGQVIPVSKVYQHVSTSPEFKSARHDYELYVVEDQIKIVVMNGGSNCFLPQGIPDDWPLRRLCNCDKHFRRLVEYTLLKIGMNRDVINEGLEKYSHLWRDKFMQIAYDLEYGGGYLYDGSHFIDTPPDLDHKANWMAMREYEYYTDHKEYVDKYGEKTPAMNMTAVESVKLKKLLRKQNTARKTFIKKWQKEKEKEGCQFLG